MSPKAKPGITRISLQLLAWSLAISLIPLTIVTTLTYNRAASALRREITGSLKTVADRHRDRIVSTVENREWDTVLFSRSPAIVNALSELQSVAAQGGLAGEIKARNQSLLVAARDNRVLKDILLLSPKGELLLSTLPGYPRARIFPNPLCPTLSLAGPIARPALYWGSPSPTSVRLEMTSRAGT